MLKRMLRRASHSTFPARDRAMILLSGKAGLRACEIAGLDWSMVLDAQGHVSGTIQVRDVIAKKRGGRRIPHASRPAARPGTIGAHHGTERAGNLLLSRLPLEGEQHRQLVRRASRSSATKAAHRTRDGAASSRSPPATSIAPVAVCATSSCSRGMPQSRRRSATSTETRLGKGTHRALVALASFDRPIFRLHQLRRFPAGHSFSTIRQWKSPGEWRASVINGEHWASLP